MAAVVEWACCGLAGAGAEVRPKAARRGKGLVRAQVRGLKLAKPQEWMRRLGWRVKLDPAPGQAADWWRQWASPARAQRKQE